jgi:hypothetical protein
MSSSQAPDSHPKDTSPHIDPEIAQNDTTLPRSPKRKRDEYDLDMDFYESRFTLNEEDPIKKVKLDTQEDRIEALNSRPSFTNLASSISLILPPEVDTVVITRNEFVVEWDKDPDSETLPPPTQVKQILKNERKELVKNAIHRNSFNIPLYYCNSSTPTEIIDKIKEEHRITVTSQINDAKTSLSSRQMDRTAFITKDALKSNKVKTTNDRLLKTIKAINESLEYFEYIPSENVPIRDKRTVSMMLVFFVFQNNSNFIYISYIL